MLLKAYYILIYKFIINYIKYIEANMNFFDLLNSYSSLISDSNLTKLDFTKKEDLDKLVYTINELKEDKTGLLGLITSSFIGEDTLNNVFDSIIKEAQQIYAEAHKDDTVKSSNCLCGASTTRKEVDNSIEPARPSDKTPEEIQNNLVKLVQDYVNEKIIPSAKLSKEQLESISDGLFEFACWIYNR